MSFTERIRIDQKKTCYPELALMTVLLLGTFSIVGCGIVSTSQGEDLSTVTVEGRLTATQVTSFMYGSHLLRNKKGKLTYALMSSKIDLNAYEGRTVRVRGTLMEGYPVDNGPKYLRVTHLEVIDES